MKILLNIAYLIAAAIYGPVVIYRMIKYNRYRTGWAGRFGYIVRKDPALKKCIWIHAVSVGEVNAAKTIVEQLRERFSDYEIVISSTTDTGFARANKLFGEQMKVFYFPLDFSWVMNRAFCNIRPAICLLMELEVWPNFIQTAKKWHSPVVVVNGRISDNSFDKYKKIRPIARTIFRNISLILAQTEEYARRFIETGCPREKVIVTGSLKYDTAQITDKVDGADELAKQIDIDNQKLWVAGATGNDEEKIILDTYQALRQKEGFGDVRLAIVPRKPERFDEVAQLIEQYGLAVVRYSRLKEAAETTTDGEAVILGDTMGDLRKFYSLASIIFVGRSLVPMGGSDMAEAAALAKCTIFGPHTFNFTHTANVLTEDAGAIMVNDKDELLVTLEKCLSNAAYAKEIGQNGQDVIRKNQGATKKTIEHIAKWLNR